MESTTATQPDHLTATFLIDAKRTGFDQSLILVKDSLLRGCLFHAGDQTSGSPFGYSADIPLVEQCSAEFFWAWVSRIGQVKMYFNQVADVELGELVSTEIAHVAEEMTAFVEQLREIPAVEELRLREIEQGFKTWVIVNNASEQARYAVYGAEWDLMRRFPHVAFDFHLVDREGEDLDSIIQFDDGGLSIRI